MNLAFIFQLTLNEIMTSTQLIRLAQYEVIVRGY